MTANDAIVRIVLEHYPATQSIYLFGTYGTVDARAESDVDIAFLLPPQQAKTTDMMAVSDLRFALEKLLKRDVDLINLRQVSTVLETGRIIA